MCETFFLFSQEYFSLRNIRFAFKNYYSWEFQTASLLLPSFFFFLLLCVALSQNANVWRPDIPCLNPLWTYFHVTRPRLDPKYSIIARGLAWTRQLPSKIGCCLFIYWCTEDHKKEFSSRLDRFLRRAPEARTVFSSAASLARFFLVEIFWLEDESKYRVISLAVRDRQ